ncbi:MAG TPA: sugar ABC transporter permease [Gemmatimonadales bacterium]|jgi:multiple sugar transport system permease protein|nr:sugar ABC transporter permease [Gemmatimonadales bacterium]
MSRAPGERGEARAAWVFLAPALILITAFFFLPVVTGLALSLTDFDLYAIGHPENVRLVGGANYRALAQAPMFWSALKNTLYFAFVGAPLSVLTALAAALLLNSRLTRWKGFFRTAYFAPFVTTLVAVAIVWKYLYHPRFGLLDAALGSAGIRPVDWLGDPRWAMPAIIVVAVWRSFGYNMLIFLAGLQRIPAEMREAADLDGAGHWSRLWHVTLPQLAPTFVFVGVITAIGFFQVFAEPYVMTGGGPLNSTLSMVLYMYQEGFRWWRLGSAASIAFVLFALVLAVTMIQLAWRREET